jgi:hypothetical protein
VSDRLSSRPAGVRILTYLGGAAALAKTLNNAAAKLAQLSAKAAQLAAEAFKALHTWPWDAAGDLWDAAKGAAGAVDEAQAAADAAFRSLSAAHARQEAHKLARIAEIGLNAAEHVGEDIAENGGGAAARVFWAGSYVARKAATDWATANGSETLEMSAEGRAVDAATRDVPWEKAQPACEAAANKLASGASGVVHVFIDSARANPESISANTELPALIKNKNVTDVVFHFLRR